MTYPVRAVLISVVLSAVSMRYLVTSESMLVVSDMKESPEYALSLSLGTQRGSTRPASGPHARRERVGCPSRTSRQKPKLISRCHSMVGRGLAGGRMRSGCEWGFWGCRSLFTDRVYDKLKNCRMRRTQRRGLGDGSFCRTTATTSISGAEKGQA